MNQPDPTEPTSFALQELCVLADMPVRTVRYYISLGLVDKPHGETRAARYQTAHLEQLLLIKRWSAQGLGLERIRELLHAPEEDTTPARSRRAGDITVQSHLLIADGLELVIDPGRAQLNPEQLRHLVRLVMQAHAQVMQPAADSAVAKSPTSPTPARKNP